MIQISEVNGIMGRDILELNKEEFENFVRFLDLIEPTNMRNKLRLKGINVKSLEKTRYKIINAWESE